MKNFVFIIPGLIRFCFAQDVIILTTGEELKSKVLEVGITEIQYKKTDSADTTIHIIQKADIQSITYKSGRTDVFNKPTVDIITLATGEKIKSKVLEVGITEIQYKKPDSADTTIHIMQKADILSITYKSGRTDVFNEPKPTTDIITLRTGEEIKSKVLVVGVNEIQYKKTDNPDTTTFILNKPDILKIKYKSGRTNVFNDNILSETNNQPRLSHQEMYQKGIQDAALYYPKKQTGAGASLVATAFFMPLGIGVTYACLSTPPKRSNLGIPDEKLFDNNSSYREGYIYQAHQMKKKKIQRTFGGATIAVIILVVVALSQIQ